MQTLSVLAVEDGAIIAVAATGERFRLPVDPALRARLAAADAAPDEKRLSPREIQAHIRAGLTAEQVAALTGVSVASIERFVGPVLAERAYIVESALAVRLPPETEGARSRTFGAVMGERLEALAAEDVRWTSAKEPSGWVLAVSFTADAVQHAARWRFDAKHLRLDADNVEASTLSQQGVPPALTPRLRAIEPTAPVTIVPQAPEPEQRPALPHGARVAPAAAVEPDRSRFDSAAFRFPTLRDERATEPPATQPVTVQHPTPPDTAAHAQPEARPKPAARMQPTAEHQDLPGRDQLARRREAREPAPEVDALPITRAMDVVETGDVFAPRPADRRTPAPVHRLPVRPAPEADAVPPAPGAQDDSPRRRRERTRTTSGAAFGLRDAAEQPGEATDAGTPAARPRRGRTSMPSWDEIVFGRDEP